MLLCIIFRVLVAEGRHTGSEICLIQCSDMMNINHRQLFDKVMTGVDQHIIWQIFRSNGYLVWRRYFSIWKDWDRLPSLWYWSVEFTKRVGFLVGNDEWGCNFRHLISRLIIITLSCYLSWTILDVMTCCLPQFNYLGWSTAWEVRS